MSWKVRHRVFLSEMTVDENGTIQPKHERLIKAVLWWCYMHSPNPLSNAEILKVMPTNKSISDIYHTIHEQSRLDASIPTWGDAIVWSDLHNYDCLFTNLLD